MKRRQPARRGAAARPPSRLARTGGPGTGGPGTGGLQWLSQGPKRSAALSPRRRRLRRIMRRTRRGMAVVLALGVLGLMVAGGLLLISPSVADAPSRVQALDRAHRVSYPGPAVPERFAAALAAASGQGAGSGPKAVTGLVLDHVTSLAGGHEAELSRYLARALYTRGRSGSMANAEVDLLAVKLDLSYPARRIVQMYADVAYFGHGWYGLKAASCGYFGTPPQRLSQAQAAMLAGVVTHLAATGRLPRAQARQPSPHPARRAPACEPGAGSHR